MWLRAPTTTPFCSTKFISPPLPPSFMLVEAMIWLPLHMLDEPKRSATCTRKVDVLLQRRAPEATYTAVFTPADDVGEGQ